MTGAMLATDANCVIPYEEIRLEDGIATLAEDLEPRPWDNIHRQGVDYQAGALLLPKGRRLRSPETATLAAQGKPEVLVRGPLRIAVISTGDELVALGQDLLPHQIYRSNLYALAAELSGAGFAQTTPLHFDDDLGALEKGIGHALEAHDILVLSGGVSMGKFDYIPKVLESLGVKEVFHRVAQRPGKPLWFGQSQSGKVVFGLPGNPVSSITCLRRYVLPALLAACGARPERHQVRLAAPLKTPKALTFFVPVHLDTQGQATPIRGQGSGDFFALVGSHGFVQAPFQEGGHPAGALLDFFPWAQSGNLTQLPIANTEGSP